MNWDCGPRASDRTVGTHTYPRSWGLCHSTEPERWAQTGSGWPWSPGAGSLGYTRSGRWTLRRTPNRFSSRTWARGQSCTACHWSSGQLEARHTAQASVSAAWSHDISLETDLRWAQREFLMMWKLIMSFADSMMNGSGSTATSTCLLKSTPRTTSDSHHRRGKHGPWRTGALWGQSDIQALNLTKYPDYCAGDNEMTKNLRLSLRTSNSSEESCYIKDYL